MSPASNTAPGVIRTRSHLDRRDELVAELDALVAEYDRWKSSATHVRIQALRDRIDRLDARQSGGVR
jgi:hypothetical protein